jgi:hypothetical protein
VEEEELPEQLLADGHPSAQSKDELPEYGTEKYWREEYRAEERDSANRQCDFC